MKKPQKVEPEFVKCIQCGVGWVWRMWVPLFDGLCRECWCRKHYPESSTEDDEVPF